MKFVEWLCVLPLFGAAAAAGKLLEILAAVIFVVSFLKKATIIVSYQSKFFFVH